MDFVGENIFVAKFKTPLENNRVFRVGPWSFDKSLIALVIPTAKDDPTKVLFKSVSFWAQIQNVPFRYMTRSMAVKLGRSIGPVEDVAGDGSEDWIGPIIWIRVAMDLEKPLRRGIMIRHIDDKELLCPIRYERLSDFCYECGLIEHTLRECFSIPLECASDKVEQYGA